MALCFASPLFLSSFPSQLEYFAKLFLGILFGGISVSWFLHIVLYILPAKPVTPFLNNFFVSLTNDVPSFPLFGVLAFALWSFFLLFCVVKGNFRLGVRFLFIKLYPMEVGNTLMNAFLFNTWIIVLCSVPAVQFCVQAFPIYTADTQASVMFGSQVRQQNYWESKRRSGKENQVSITVGSSSLFVLPVLLLWWFRFAIWMVSVTSSSTTCSSSRCCASSA
jgi:hypothetical protein